MRRPLSLAAAGAVAAVAMLGAGPRGSHAQPRPPTSATPRLVWPVACVPGRTCWVQNYMDRDPSPAARDYACGTLTYEKHSGTDIRLPDMAAQRAGVDVLAAADGKVLRVRDAVPDISVRTTGLAAVAGTECGNGLVIAHGGGWESQYCHMARGSLRVRPGDRVTAGQSLGHVGLSGETEFPHLHFTLHHQGELVDPFAPSPPRRGTCGSGESLWREAPPYAARAVINAGFAGAAVEMEEIESGTVTPPGARAPVLSAYVRPIGLKVGDEQTLSLSGPDGRVLAASTRPALRRNAAQDCFFVGKRLRSGAWARGTYHASYLVRVHGRPVLRRDFELRL